MTLHFRILETDVRFDGNELVGERLCSRCGQSIDEEEVPLMAWPRGGEWLLRYHLRCVEFGEDTADDER